MRSMKPVYVFVRVISLFCIGTAKLAKFIAWDIYVLLKQAWLRTKYWEDRILITALIAFLNLIVLGGLPILLCFTNPHQVAHIDKARDNQLVWENVPTWDWLGMLGATATLEIPFGMALYYANRRKNRYDNSTRFTLKDEIMTDQLKWAATIELPKKKQISAKIEPPIHDPDYRASVMELEEELDASRHFDARLRARKAIPAKIR